MKNDAKWKVPPLPEKKKGAEVVEKGDRYGRVERSYHHMKITSHKVLFVIDVSASMLDPIRVKRGRNEADGTDQGEPEARPRARGARATLRTLDEHTNFNVIAFESDIRFFKKEAVPGTPGNVQEAIQWVEKQKPRTISTRRRAAVERRRRQRDDDGPHEHVRRSQGGLRPPLPPKKKGEGGVDRPVHGPEAGDRHGVLPHRRRADRGRDHERRRDPRRTSSSGTARPGSSSTRSG